MALVGMGTALAQDTNAHRGTIERVDGAVYLVKARLTAVVGGRADMSQTSPNRRD
jgi:hypothetical protein